MPNNCRSPLILLKVIRGAIHTQEILKCSPTHSHFSTDQAAESGFIKDHFLIIRFIYLKYGGSEIRKAHRTHLSKVFGQNVCRLAKAEKELKLVQ